MRYANLAVLLLMCFTRLAYAGGVANVTHLNGVLAARHPDGSVKLLAVNSEVDQGDLLVTERDTHARIKFADGSEIVLRPGSQLKVEKFSFDQAKPESDSLLLNMLKGGMRAVSGIIGKRNKGAVAYTTPTATIGIRGTHFGALYCHGDCDGISGNGVIAPRDGLYLDVAQGAIEVTTRAGSTILNAGEFGFVEDEATLPTVVPVQQGIQVTVPLSIIQNAAGGGAGSALAGKEAECIAN